MTIHDPLLKMDMSKFSEGLERMAAAIHCFSAVLNKATQLFNSLGADMEKEANDNERGEWWKAEDESPEYDPALDPPAPDQGEWWMQGKGPPEYGED